MRISNPVARFGENIACKYLLNKGYKIIDRNFRKGYGEIDIVATKENILIFIEVKTRATSLFGGAMEAISNSKLHKLIRTAEYYKVLNPKLPDSLRIDAILIDLDEENAVKKLEHLENITGF